MNRLFLDANVLFSAAYRADSGLLKLWRLEEVELCSSRYAVEEARINLEDEIKRQRLTRLCRSLLLFESADRVLPSAITMPDKDAPILLAAMEAQATHLLTGDIRHFGRYIGKRIEGILVLTPADYLRTVTPNR